MENYFRSLIPLRDEPPLEMDLETWLIRYRLVRIREAIIHLGHACNSYAAEDGRSDGVHEGRLAKRRHEVDLAAERYGDAKRPIEAYSATERAELERLYGELRGKIPES